MMKTKIRTTMVAMLVTLLAAPACAQDLAADNTTNAEDAYPLTMMGEDIATLWCDACHIISHSDDDEGFDGAPPFPSMAPMVKANPDYYIAFLTQPHARPMEAITISSDGITAILAYIASLDKSEE